MPTPKNLKREEAFRLWNISGRQRELADIARELDVSASLVRKWKSIHKWDSKPKYKGKPVISNNYVSGKSKRGFRFGAYSKVHKKNLTAEEFRLINDFDYDEEFILQERIDLLRIRERRLFEYIFNQKTAADNQFVDTTETIKSKGTSSKLGEEKKIEEINRTTARLNVIQKLENELTRVQSQLTKCATELRKMRNERLDREMAESKNNENAIDDWISSVLEDDESELEDE